MAETRTIVVDAPSAGSRLDTFLARAGLSPSAAAARRAIADGGVLVDGRRAPKGARLAAGQVVAVTVEGHAAVRPSPELTIDVLYEDQHLVAIDKPAGIASHPLRAGEGPTAAGAIVARFPECADASPHPREGGLVHRLDGGTSGVLIAARTRDAWARLRDTVGGGACEKEYLAEVLGTPEAPPPGLDPFVRVSPDRGIVVDAPIGRSGRRGGKVRVGAGREPLDARTLVTIVERRGETTLVAARLSRGRAHQVRAHLAHLGTPVVGDAIYGRATPSSGLHLHARSITFVHPFTSTRVEIQAPPPSWARRAL